MVAIPKGLDICITDNLAEHGERGVFVKAGFREGSRRPIWSFLDEEFVDMYN